MKTSFHGYLVFKTGQLFTVSANGREYAKFFTKVQYADISPEKARKGDYQVYKCIMKLTELHKIKHAPKHRHIRFINSDRTPRNSEVLRAPSQLSEKDSQQNY